MNTGKILLAILIPAMVTFGLRALPFLIFRSEKDLPDKTKQLGAILPTAITAVMLRKAGNADFTV